MWQKIKENLTRLQREPILFATTLAWLMTVILEKWAQILPILVFLHVPENYQQALLKTAGFVVALTAWWQARKFTTPVADPRDGFGNPLTHG